MEEKQNQKPASKLAGPIVSFVIHAVILCLLIRFATQKLEEHSAEIEITVNEASVAETIQQPIDNTADVENEITEDQPALDVDLPEPDDVSDFRPEEISDPLQAIEQKIEFDQNSEKSVESAQPSIPKIYSGRNTKNRESLLREYGGNKKGQDAVIKALNWLKGTQFPNGSWSNKPAHTGLALLCFLAHGETPESSHYGKVIQQALRYLVKTLPPKAPLRGKPAYVNGISIYALAEAYGVTKVPFIRTVVETGLQTIVDGQQASGGFDYKYKKTKRWDLSITGWQIQALKAGYFAGASVSGIEEALAKAVKFVKKTYKDGKFGYSSPGTGGNMTGVGTLCLQLLGDEKSTESRGGVRTISTERIVDYHAVLKTGQWSKIAGKNLYGWYYDTQAMFHQGGAAWEKWNKVFQEVLIQHQKADGHWEVDKASYGFTDDLAGKVYCTTLCCLQLEVYYRYLPTYKIPVRTQSHEARKNITDDDDFGIYFE